MGFFGFVSGFNVFSFASGVVFGVSDFNVCFGVVFGFVLGIVFGVSGISGFIVCFGVVFGFVFGVSGFNILGFGSLSSFIKSSLYFFS